MLQSINADARYQDNDIIRSYSEEVELMAQAAAGGFNLGFESSEHQSNDRAGEVINAGPIADLVQRVMLNGDNVDQALSDTSRAIAEIMSG